MRALPPYNLTFPAAAAEGVVQSDATGALSTSWGRLEPDVTERVALGYEAGNVNTTGRNNIYIGHAGAAADESGTVRIGTAATHTETHLSGTVHATAFVGDGSGLTNLDVAANTGVLDSREDPRSGCVEDHQRGVRRGPHSGARRGQGRQRGVRPGPDPVRRGGAVPVPDGARAGLAAVQPDVPRF